MYMTHHNRTQTQNAGIALLMTMMVLGVVLAVTLAIVELSLQQLALSVDSKDSEIAFHAANAGLECARYTRRNASSSFETLLPATIPVNCFGVTSPDFTKQSQAADGIEIVPGSGAGSVWRYSTALTWAGGTRCSVMDIISIKVDAAATADLTIRADGTKSLKTIFPGYPTDTKACAPGAVCTIASVAGYNAACAAKDSAGVLKRQVLLEF